MVLLYRKCQSRGSGSHCLAHVLWYFAARDVLVNPPDVYLRYFIILPAIGLSALNIFVHFFVHSDRFSLPAREYSALSLHVIYAFYVTMTHEIAVVLLCSYILPIFISTIFSNVKLTRLIFWTSMAAVGLFGVKMYVMGKLGSSIVMQIIVTYVLFVCSYLLAEILIRYGKENAMALVNSNKEAMNNELAFLQAQIKPHFLYNAINTIVSFCYTDSERAAKLLIDFSKYLRLVFDVDHKSAAVPLEREIELIRAYVEIEKARFGGLIDVRQDIDPELLSVEIPSFCIQPLVENAIKHGLLKKDSGGTVTVSVKKRPGRNDHKGRR